MASKEEIQKYLKDEADRRNMPPTRESYALLLAELRRDEAKQGTKLIPTSFNDPSARGSMIVGGALTGGALGAPAGPVGTAVGAATGAAFGSVAHRTAQTTENALRGGASVGDVALGALTPPTTPEQLQRTGMVAKEAALEGGLSLAGESVASGIGLVYRGGLRRLSGLTPRAERRAMLSERFGSPLGLQDVSDSGLVQSQQAVFGVFPFLGKPWLDAAKRRSGQIIGPTGAAQNLFNEVGPVVMYQQAGNRVMDSAELAFSMFKDKANILYSRGLEMARRSGAVVPVSETRTTAAQILRDIGTQPRTVKVGKAGLESSRRTPTGFKKLRKLADDAAALDEAGMTVDEFRAFSSDIVTAIDKAKGKERALLIQLKAALEKDFATISAPPEVLAALNQADEFYAEGMRTFGSETGRRIKRVNRNFGDTQLRRPGTRSRDEVIDTVLGNDPSPDAIASMRKILMRAEGGEEAWRTVVRNRLQRSLDAALKVDESSEIVTLDAKKMRQALGLDERVGKRFGATKEMLKDTGVTVRDLDEFIEVTEDAFKLGIPNPSTFARRRVTLGGISALVGLTAPGATAAVASGGSLPVVAGTVLATIWGTRKMGRLLTDPKALKALRVALDPSNSTVAQRRALRRLSLVQPSIFSAEALAQSLGGRTSDYIDLFASASQSPRALYQTSLSGVTREDVEEARAVNRSGATIRALP